MRRFESFVDDLADRHQRFAGDVAGDGVIHFRVEPDEGAGAKTGRAARFRVSLA